MQNETEERKLIKNMVQEFVDKEIMPVANQMDMDSDSVDMKAFYKRAGELGILGMSIPEEYGGMGCDYTTAGMIYEELGKASSVFALNVGVHACLCYELIKMLATPEQKAELLPDMASGKKLYALCNTEAVGCLNHTEWNVTAEETDDGFVINGSKMLISQACLADAFCVVAVTKQPVNPVTREGISAFVVDANIPGITVGEAEKKYACHGSASATVSFNNVLVPKSALIGPLNNGAAALAVSCTNEFMDAGLICLGMAEQCYEMTLEYARQRIQRGKNLFDNYQTVRHSFAEMYMKIEMLRDTCYAVLAAKDAGQMQMAQCRMLKVQGSKIANEVAAACLQVFGGVGCICSTGIDRYWRDSKMFQIAGEASEALIDDIAGLIGQNAASM